MDRKPMDLKILIPLLESEWDQPDGFLGQLRMRIFDKDAYARFLQFLQSIEFEEKEETIDRRVVSLLWFIPTFMEWQKSSLMGIGVEEREISIATGTVVQDLFRILEVP